MLKRFLLLLFLLVYLSFDTVSQNKSYSDQNYSDSTKILLSKFLCRDHVFVGESHMAHSNLAFQSEIVTYYLKHDFNTIVIERGYAEAYLLKKAIFDKDKALIRKIWIIDSGLSYGLLINIIDSVINNSITTPTIIGIDYEQSIEFTKWVINDVLFACNLVQRTNETPRNSRISNLVYLDYDPPLVFLNDTIKNFYDEINNDEDIDLKKFDSIYEEFLFNEIKYRKWFKGQFELVLRCINAVRMCAYEDCIGENDANVCNKREAWMFENFTKFVIEDSLKSIGVFGSNHILKVDDFIDANGQNYKSFVAQLIKAGYSVASFFPIYTDKIVREYIFDNHDRYFIDEEQFKCLQLGRGKRPFMLYEQPITDRWAKSKSLFDLIIVTGK